MPSYQYEGCHLLVDPFQHIWRILPTTEVLAITMSPPVPVTHTPVGSIDRQFPVAQPAGTTIVLTGLTVPETWSPRNIASFQAHFDATFSGNLVLKSKVRFLPGGMKPFDVKNANGESMWAEWDEMMVRLVCYGYSVSPAPFIKMINRSTAQNAQQIAEQEGLYPLMSYW